MRAVIADAGNTRVAFAAWTGADSVARCERGIWTDQIPLERLGSVATPRDEAGDRVFLEAAAVLLQGCRGVPLVLVSVVPRIEPLLATLAADLRRVDHRAPLPFAHRLREPAATGPDRLCNMAAAAAAGLTAALVVDAGTATTCDVLSGGVYLGGVIAPGMAFALEQIGRQAARLGPQTFSPVPLVAGPDTASALAAGGFHAGIGGVETLISGLQAAHGPLPVVVTGGLGHFLARPDRHHDPDWTLRGAASLAGMA